MLTSGSLSRAPRWVSHEAAWVTAPCTDSLALIKNHILYKGPDDPNARPLKLHIQRRYTGESIRGKDSTF